MSCIPSLSSIGSRKPSILIVESVRQAKNDLRGNGGGDVVSDSVCRGMVRVPLLGGMVS
jgi:hypothetical protein